MMKKEPLADGESNFRNEQLTSEVRSPEEEQAENDASMDVDLQENDEHEERCSSPDSDKSAPDAAYEFETGDYIASSDEEFDNDYFDDLIENASNTDDVVSDMDEAGEESSLFDSGFGSMKNYPLEKSQDTRRSPRKHKGSNVRNVTTRSSLSETRKTRSTATKSISKSNAKVGRKKKNSKEVSKTKLSSSKSSTSSKAEQKSLRNRKPSDIDSGKDSPKAARTAARSKKFQHIRRRRASRSSQGSASSNAQYHTRSSRHKLLGQEEFSKKLVHQRKKAKQRSAKRKRAWKSRYNKTLEKVMNLNEDDEVKFAAGSLLHLAGLLKSPFHLPV